MTYSVVCLLCILVYISSSAAQDATIQGGYRLPNNFQYLALAPKTVRPDQTYNVFVTIYSVPYTQILVRATLSRNGEEYASGTTVFTQKGTKNVQLLIPITALPGNHKLSIEGLITDGFGVIGVNGTGDSVPLTMNTNFYQDRQPIFKNETVVHFHTKYVSLFITTDRPVYFPPNKVYYRILGVTPGLDPINGVMTIYVKDSNGVIIRRWLQKQLNFGTYADDFDIPYPVSTGNWTLSVDAFGHVYHQQFMVNFFYQRRFDVIVLCPLFVFDTEWGFSCTVEGEHTSSRAVEGNATLTVKIRNPDGTFMMGKTGNLKKRLSYVTGVTPFDFTMKAVEEEFGEVHGKEIYMVVDLYEFWSMEAIEGHAIIKVKKDGVIIKALGKKYRAFKPKTPFEVVFVVQRSDGTPYEGFLNRQIAIQTIYEGTNARTIPEDKVVVPDDSVVRHTVHPEEGDKKIIIRAWHVITMQTVEIECYRYWSEKNKFISISSSTVEPKVNEYMIFTVRTNFFIDEVDYLLMGQGNILLGSSVTMKKLQKTFAIALSRDMAPAARIMVYCIVDGIILTDALNFHVQDKRLHKAELIINRAKDFKGDHVELIGKGFPGAFMSFQGHDWEFHRRGASTFINERKVIRELLTYNEGISGTDNGDFGNDVDLPFQQIWYYPDDRWEGSVFFTAPTSGINHETTFNVSGLVALSDMNLTVTPESTHCNRTNGYGRCLSGVCFQLKDLCDGKIDCTEDGYDEMACPINDSTPPRPTELDNLHLAATFFTDGDWLWQTTYVKYTGQTEIMVDVPDTDALFALSAFVIHPVEGLAIVDQPQEYDTTRQFYMTVEGPEIARRGEQLGVRCTVFNEWDQEQQVIMTLHGSDEYRFVVVEEYGIVRSYDPRTLTGDIQIMVWMQPFTSKYIFFPVLPSREDDVVNIAVTAYSMLRTTTKILTVRITYDGVLNEKQEPYLVDLVNQGSVIIPDFDIPIPERFFIPEQRELLYVPGSNNAQIYIYGDVVSPGFFQDHLDCENTAEFPQDSADGYMYEFAVNLQTLRYLQTINALTQEAEDKALSYMKSIVARQYAYMDPNGGFKMFRRTEKPCIWLTSFILHYFHKAQMSEWNEEVFIDMNTLNKVAFWLADQFNMTTKQYVETANYIYDRDMLPFTTDKNNVTHEWNIPLTAQVMITLAKATRITGEAKGKADIVVNEAGKYLTSKLLQITNPFQMAIVAYALNAANFGSAQDAFTLLKQMKRETEYVYWSQYEVPPNEVQIVNTRQLMQPKKYWYNTGHAVSATAYALMIYLDHNEFVASRPIMKWLQTQHNKFMAWSSSRDGLLALEALTDYAFRETNRDIYQMQLTIEATQPRNPTWRHTVYLNKTNFAHLHHFSFDQAWGEFRAYAQGTGYAYIHVESLVKVEKPWLVQTPKFKNYALRLAEANFYGRNASHINMTWCVKWIRPDLANQSGMMFMEINVPTGYVISRNVIEWMYVSGVPGLKRVRNRNSMLYVFFETVTQQDTCFEYMMERWYPVSNMSIPHQAKVYEYTETGNQLNTMYETYTLFHLHICQVCGSFQCPYCPFYNVAPSTSPNTMVIAALVLMAVFIGQLSCGWTHLFNRGVIR